MNGIIRTSYVEKVCPVPPLVGQAAYDDIVAKSLHGDGWLLRITGALAEGQHPDPLRSASGLLVASWLLRVAVVVELNAWSSRRVTVGIRPAGRDAPPMWTSLYFGLAHSAAGRLADGILEWAERPLHDLPLSA